jgi:tetratricopeptide (TPR) repeat protein
MARRIALLFGFFVVVVGWTSVSAEDVYLKGRPAVKKTAVKAESPKGITVTSGDKYAEGDIDNVFFDDNVIGGLLGLTYGQAFRQEKLFLDTTKDVKARTSAYIDATTKYDELRGKVGDKRAKAHLEFSLGYLMALKSLEDNTDPKNAIVRLNDFVKSNPQSWQLVRSLKMLAKLHQAMKDYAGAKAANLQLSTLDVPDEVKQDALLQVAMADVYLGQFEKAEPKLAELLKTMPKDSAVYARTQMAQAQCLLATNKNDEAMVILKKTVKDSPDKTLKAVAHNTLGVSLFNAEKYKEARWEFLWVDVVYNADKAEHAKALYYLTQTFEKLGETPKADECRDQLLNDKTFAGTDFQRKMQKEKTK